MRYSKVVVSCITVTLFLLMTDVGKSQSAYELVLLQDEIYRRIDEVRNSSLPKSAKIKRIRHKVDTLLTITASREKLARDIKSQYQLARIKADLLRVLGESEDSYCQLQRALELFDREEIKIDFGYYFDASSYYYSKRWLLIRLIEVRKEMQRQKPAYIDEYLASHNQGVLLIYDDSRYPVDIAIMNENYEYVEKNFEEEFVINYLQSYYQPLLSGISYNEEQEIFLVDYIIRNHSKAEIDKELERLSGELIYDADNLSHRLHIGFTFLGFDLCIYPPFDQKEFDKEKSQNIYSSFVSTRFYSHVAVLME